MLEVKSLNFHYGNVQALYDVTITAPPGQITCVMGRNGVGKTTLLKNIMGVESRTSGASPSPARISPICRPTSGRGRASRWCRRGA